MSRSCAYRREISDACNWHQDQALNSTIYILYQTGPTGFLLNEEGESKKFKVFLGDVHNCTCSVFKKEKDLCKHICWVILKKFRVPRNDPLSWQLGLNEREINQMIRGDVTEVQKTKSTKVVSKSVSNNNKQNNENANQNENEQRAITESDVCPICQDEFLAKKLPVSYCKTCGNNVHIKCMKVWADHQKSNGESELKCPLCREVFSTFELLDQEFRNNSLFKQEKQDLHYGLSCANCKSSPITGKCYKCTSCNEFYLCQACFNTDFHNKHSFVFREKINQKYRRALRDHVGLIPQAIAQSLQTRELDDQDYELLLQLNSNTNPNKEHLSQIPEKVIKAWPSEKVRENSQLLNPGIQCRICLRGYQPNQLVRKLPGCKHKFHLDCIDNWLLHSHPTCPIDGLIVWDPITAQIEQEEKKEKNKLKISNQNTNASIPDKNIAPDLSVGLMINYKSNQVDSKEQNSTLNQNKNKKVQSNRVSSTEKHKQASSNSKFNNLKIEIEGKNVKQIESLEPISIGRLVLPRIENKPKSMNLIPPIKNNNTQFLNTNFDNILNISSLLSSKPYQLTRFNDTSSIQSSNCTRLNHQSDFYDYDDIDHNEYEDFNLNTDDLKVEDYDSSLNSGSKTELNSKNSHLILELEQSEHNNKINSTNKNNYVINRIKLKKLNSIKHTKSNTDVPSNLSNNKQENNLPLVFGTNFNNKNDA